MEVIRSYDWNGKRYSVVRRDDGTQVEVKGEVSMTDSDAMDKCPETVVKELPPTVISVKDLSDEVLMKEVESRKLEIPIISRAL